MCVRYDELLEIFLVWSKHVGREIELPPNAAAVREKFPGHPARIGRIETGSLEIVEARWGLTPFWATDPAYGRKNGYNARSETVFDKPSFREAIRKRRCIVPAQSFYERDRGHWFRFRSARDEPLAFAGIYETPNRHWDTPTFAMVTTEPSQDVSDIHDRMPVVLQLSDLDLWLDPDAPESDLRALMVPFVQDSLVSEDAGPISVKPESQDGVLPF